jgi:hypothetical protein
MKRCIHLKIDKLNNYARKPPVREKNLRKNLPKCVVFDLRNEFHSNPMKFGVFGEKISFCKI